MELKAGEAIPETFKEWFRADLRHANEWRKAAKLEYDFRDGHQYTDDERDELEEKNKPDAEFNFIGPIVDAISGQEISNRQEVAYLPREISDQQATELLTSAALWFRDRADADDNDSEAFKDTITAGMGWTETRLDYESNPDGDLRDDRIDPFEMVWDHNARKRNLIDANRIWRVRCMPVEEALSFFSSATKDGKPAQYDAEDLNAEWAESAVWDGGQQPHVSEAVRDRSKGRRSASGELEEVVVVHCQWIEREDVHEISFQGKRQKVPQESWQKLKDGYEDRVEQGMIPQDSMTFHKRKAKVRYQAFLGNKVLKVMPTACPDHFNFKCITGKRDQNKGQFYGIVRAAMGPQKWSNKLYSEMLFLVAVNAKGGIIAEHGAFDNDADAEDSWAKADRITWAKNGALSGPNPKWAQKPIAQVPPALQYLLEVASTSIFKATGVNMELLGMREADQAGVLEYQRRQAGLIILQAFFDSLKSYRREQGELILYYIQNDLNDGRFIRIVGDADAEPVPLALQASLEYDIVVADSPSSPNQKEKTWQLITAMMPFLKDFMTPDVALALAEDSPLPSKTVQKLQKAAKDAAESPQAKLQEMMGQLEARVTAAEAALKEAQARKADAEAQKTANEAPEDPNAKLAIEEAKATGKLSIEREKAANQIQLEREKTQANIGLAQEKQASDFALRQSEQAQNQQIQAANAQQDMRLKEQTAQADMMRADTASSADIARKDQQAKAAAKRTPTKPKK